MKTRVLTLSLVLAGFALAGPMLSPDPVSASLNTDTRTIDLSVVPMDDIDIEIDVQPARFPSGTTAASLGDRIAAATIATPEPATYAITALALLAVGTIRRRK